jgi:ferredoxin-type protein NapH
MKVPNNPLKFRYHAFRGRLLQPLFWALVFLGPVFNIVRVDMLTQHVVYFGKAYPFNFNSLMWLPIGFYGAVIIIGIVSFVWGRLFCGWTCPHNTLTEWTVGLRALVGREAKPVWLKRLMRKVPAPIWVYRTLSILLGFALTFTLSVLLSFYVIPPDWGTAQYLSGAAHPALVCGNLLLMLIGLFLLYAGHDFCRTCCPYGMAQSISAYHENSRWRPMEIQFTGDQASECKTCQGCQSVCPVEIDPRDGTLAGMLKVGQFDGCFNCGECIDACKTVQQYRGKKGLLSFKLGGKSAKLKPAPILPTTPLGLDQELAVLRAQSKSDVELSLEAWHRQPHR